VSNIVIYYCKEEKGIATEEKLMILCIYFATTLLITPSPPSPNTPPSPLQNTPTPPPSLDTPSPLSLK